MGPRNNISIGVAAMNIHEYTGAVAAMAVSGIMTKPNTHPTDWEVKITPTRLDPQPSHGYAMVDPYGPP